MNTILTIGYEGANVEDFIATLQLANVKVVIDIRDIPVSRKRGFSKRALAEMLEGSGLQYVHLRALGDPKPGRDAARRGDIATFEKVFREHLEGDAPQDALMHALEISADTQACLLCFERDHSHCHRTIVAEEMANRECVQIRHIGVRHGLAEDRTYQDEYQRAFG